MEKKWEKPEMVQQEKKLKRSPEYYYESEKGVYVETLKTYIKEFKKHHGRNPTRTEVREAVKEGKTPGVPTVVFERFDVFSILGIEKIHSGGVQNTFSDTDLEKAVKEAFEEKCRQEAKKLKRKYLTKEEVGKLKLGLRNYDSLRESGVINGPSVDVLLRRFGPSWENVLKKCGLLKE